MEELRKNGVKVFFISSENSHENITDLNSLKLFHNYKQPLNISGRTDRQVEESLKSCLKSVVEKRMDEVSRTNQNQNEMSTTNVRTTTSKYNKNLTISTRGSSINTKSSFDADGTDFYEQDQKNAVFVNGQSLQFILKDETL